MAEDCRLLWFRDRILKLLNERDPLLFYDVLEREGGLLRSHLNTVLNEDVSRIHELGALSSYFYKTYYEKIIQEEVIVAEEVTAEDETVHNIKRKKYKTKGRKDEMRDGMKVDPDEDVDNAEQLETSKVDNTKGVKENEPEITNPPVTKKEIKKKNKFKKERGKSPRTAVEVPPSADPEYVYVSKLVEKVVEAPELHAHIGPMQNNAMADSLTLIYIIRQSLLRVPHCDTYVEASAVMPSYFLIGSIKGDFVGVMASAFNYVFEPCVSKQFREPEADFTALIQSARKNTDEEDEDFSVFSQFQPPSQNRRFFLDVLSENNLQSGTSDGGPALDKASPVKLELIHELRELTTSLNLVHTKPGDKSLSLGIPDIDVNNIPEERYVELMQVLKDAVNSFLLQIVTTLALYKSKKPTGKGPLVEIQFWEDRVSGLGALAEQLGQIQVRNILEKVNVYDSDAVSAFRLKELELKECLNDGIENVKLLSTILRHIKRIAASNSFECISNTLPDLVEGLHIIWILSRFYCQDETMISLMSRISWLLCSKVSSSLKSDMLFKGSLSNIISQTQAAQKMLESWKRCYLDKRSMIEASGVEKRWEFDQNRLFFDTEYSAKVCGDLLGIAEVLQEFLIFFGPDFKAIIKNPSHVDSVIKRIENLVVGIELTDFDIYKPSCRDNWHAVIEAFYKDVKALENELVPFIDQSFGALRSSEDALELLLKFKERKTRQSIYQKLMTKYDVVMQHFIQEISAKHDIFHRGKRDPPTLRYQPHDSGAIFWEKLLFISLKTSILRFQQVEEIKNSNFKEEAFNDYKSLAREMKEFEDNKYRNWLQTALPFCSTVLQRPLLKLIGSGNNLPVGPPRLEPKKNFIGSASFVSSKRPSLQNESIVPSNASLKSTFSDQKYLATPLQSINQSLKVRLLKVSRSSRLSTTKSVESFERCLCKAGVKLDVNIPDGIFNVITEAELMDYLGFSIPSAIRSIVLQKDRLHLDITALKKFISEFYNILSSLSVEQMEFTKDIISLVEKHILPGYSRLNWNSLAIGEYVSSCESALMNLSSALSQIQSIEDKLEVLISSLASYDLFGYQKHTVVNAKFECRQFFQNLEETRTKNIREMVAICSNVGPLLLKLENLIHHTGTGTDPTMALYYTHWEKRIVSTLLKSVVSSLAAFNKALKGTEPMFTVAIVLNLTDVTVSPPPTEMHNLTVRSIFDCLEKFKLFSRWRPFSCLPSEQLPSDQHFVSSFYEDISRNPEVNEILVKLRDSALQMPAECERKLAKWKKYAGLWSDEIGPKCDDFTDTKPTLNAYDEKFSFYSEVSAEVGDMPPFEDVWCVQVDIRPMISTIQNFCTNWKNELGSRLAAATRKEINYFLDYIKSLNTKLNAAIITMDDFKEVLETIAEIQNSTVSAEISCDGFQETYHVLSLHNIYVLPDEVTLSNTIKVLWQQLYVSSMYRGQALQPTKEKFAATIKTEVADFLLELEDFCNLYLSDGPGNSSDLKVGTYLMTQFEPNFVALENKRRGLVEAAILFDLPPADYRKFLSAKLNFKLLQSIFNVYNDFVSFQESISKQLWLNLNTTMLTRGIDDLMKTFRQISPKCEQPAITAVYKKLRDFKSIVSLMIDLKSDSLVERHWHMLMDKTGTNFDISPDKFILRNIFEMDLQNYPGIVEDIIAGAEKEMAIDNGIKDISTIWKKITFIVAPHYLGEEQRGFVLTCTEEILQNMQDNSMALQGMSTSQFIGPFLPIVGKLEKSLSLIADVIDELVRVQCKWMYLEGIFISGDIRTQLPDVTRKFDDVDRTFRKIMGEIAFRPNIKERCEVPGRLAELQALNVGLDNCQKSLNDYLQTKRNIFPRFFFLSDDELLSILGNSDPRLIQPHVSKMFDNVCSLSFAWNAHSVVIATAMISFEKELMEFVTSVVVEGKCETYLNKIVTEMKVTNWYITKRAVYNYGKCYESRTDWMLLNLGMVCLVANQIWWTAEVEDKFLKISKGEYNVMKDYLQTLNQQLNELVIRAQGELSRNDRKKLNAVLIIDVHARDIVDGFVKNSIVDSQDFEWESQLRFYWKKDADSVVVEQCSCALEYGYEYLGLSGRLVITPLTDRIYLTFTQALSLHLGGAPAGPAGTGKTETTKDLAKALGILCIVTNCGEGMDYKVVGKILNGLAQSGAWGCFDEFNRIDISVLSVISTQLQTIRHALVMKLKSFNFEGQDISIDSKVGVFITMNPGYAGRTELPESVKSLFRPVVCVIPDLEMICLIMLLSEGFLKAKILGKKMTVLYRLSREQLSKQYHYDFGLRALKAALILAGELKRQSSDLDEEVILMKALRDINLAKFVYEDAPLFLGLIKDLFPGCNCESDGYETFVDTVRLVLSEAKYDIIQQQVEKILQLSQTMKTRHSTMIVGPSGGGKTVIIRALQDSQTFLGTPTFVHMLNPKACTVNELYGVLDSTSRDWVDGLLSNVFRDINRFVESSELHYILFDGDVDALWIENMNSVMDDNKLLTLPNGERIRLQAHCSLLFEVGNLMYASPATVSRAGMVFVDPKNMSFHCIWNKWLRNYEGGEEKIECLNSLFAKFATPVAEFIIKGISGTAILKPLRQIIPQSALNMVAQLCKILDGTLPKATFGCADSGREDEREILECLFIQAIYFSFGATIIAEDRVVFDDLIKKTSGMLLVEDNETKKAGARVLPVGMKTLYDYFFNAEELVWVPWKSIVPLYLHDRLIVFSDILVPTVDTCRAKWFLQLLRSVNQPVSFVGETGASKTAVVLDYLRQVPSFDTQVLKMNFSSKTTSKSVQKSLETVLEKRTKRVYGPPIGTKLLVFIDDLNMPLTDTYGTQQPVALLKLLFELGGFYDIEKDLSWISIMDVYFMSAMGKSGGGRAEVDPRFLSKLALFNMTYPQNDTIIYIYQSILRGHCAMFPDVILVNIQEIVATTLQIFHEIIEALPPIPSRFHYVFSPRDLSRIVAGLCQMEPENFKSVDFFIRLWRHEFIRVICDRLINQDDLKFATDKITGYVTEKFPESAVVVLADPILFGDFRNAFRPEEPRAYEDLLDYEASYFLFQEILEIYKESGGMLDIVLFDHAIEHLTRIHRVLRINRGHMMIVGVEGSGKRCMTTLAAFAAGCSFFEITLTRSYNIVSFQEDIKKLYHLVGVENKPTTFFFTASQIIDDGFLEIINNVLAIGVVSSLYTDEERTDVINALAEDAEKSGFANRKEQIWSYFCERCQRNLHIVLSMSPLGDTLRTRCRNFPGLVNYVTLNWFFPWPEEALISVAKAFLLESLDVVEKYRLLVVSHVVYVHSSMSLYSSLLFDKFRKKNYVTPKHFICYITKYLELIKGKLKFINDQSERLTKGLKKIAEARIQLGDLSEKLALQSGAVNEKSLACDSLLTVIKTTTAAANEKKNAAIQKKKEMEEKEKVILIEKSEAMEILETALPILEAAKTALGDLDKSDITEIRSFATPPQAVQTVCECVLYLLGVKEISWKSAKAVMSDPYFIMHLRELNCEQITLTQQRLCRTHAKNLPTDLRATSNAAHGLMMFIQAVLGYCAVYREVKPKQDKVEQLLKENTAAQNYQKELLDELTSIQNQLDDLNIQYKAAMADQKLLKDETNLMQKRLIAADKLMNGLSSEEMRWQRDWEVLQNDQELIFGDCLISAAFLSYIGPFSFEMRRDIVHNDWCLNVKHLELPLSKDFRLEKLVDDIEIQKWNAHGLPIDEFSVQNGILATQSSRFPICIDPQEQAASWLRKMEEKNLKTTNFNDPEFIKNLEMSIQFGFPLIFEDVEDFVDPIIEPVLEKKFRYKGARCYVVLGGKEIDVDSKFRLYLVSKLVNPKLNPTIFAKANVINFTVTMAGLESQLLSVVVLNERPDLEETRGNLIQDAFFNSTALGLLEETLLRELSAATGNMLDNADLISVLEHSKLSATKLISQLEESKRTSNDIDRLRNEYRAVAQRGAVLYFLLADMASVNLMYQYSLRAFLEVFTISLRKAKPEPFLKKRLQNIITVLTMNIYEYGCLGIFKHDHLLFAFQLTLKLEQLEGSITPMEVDFFIKGNSSLKKTNKICPLQNLSAKSWEDITSLAADFSSIFGTVLSDISSSCHEWEVWYSSDAPETEKYPCGYSERLQSFHKMLLLRCFRPDRIYRSITDFVSEKMGVEYVSSPTISLAHVFEKCAPSIPVLFMLSPGSDPSSELMKFSDSCGMSGRLKCISLGQGQEEIAFSMLENAIHQGQWLMIQNCHLLLRFVKTIEKYLDIFTCKTHPDFRLWLTTDPSPNFPIGVLQRSLKVVIEPPMGLRLNLRNTFLRLSSQTFDSCSHPHFKPIVYVLSFFHSVVQERRKYGKIGWNVYYDFNEADFDVSLQLIGTYLTKALGNDDKIPWKSLRYLIGEVVYGGKVVDDFDRRLVQTYMEEYLGDFLFDSYRPFHFYVDESFDYILPHSKNLKEIIDFTECMPIVDQPAIFGLHPDSEIGFYTNSVKMLWSHLIEIQPNLGHSEGGISRDEVVDRTCLDLLSKIPKPFDLLKIRKSFEMRMTPTTVFLLQELERFNNLTDHMEKSLLLLRNALAGEAEMDLVLEEIIRSIYNGMLPMSWKTLMPDTMKSLGSWLEHFEKRTLQYNNWSSRGEPIVIWLSGLHVPQAFISALIQKECRANGWSLERANIYTAVSEHLNMEDLEYGLDQGCYVEGLFIEGARWGREEACLQTSKSKTLIERLPILKIIATNKNIKLENTVKTPVYTTLMRRNAAGVGLVFEADLCTNRHASHWILQGVCLLLNQD